MRKYECFKVGLLLKLDYWELKEKFSKCSEGSEKCTECVIEMWLKTKPKMERKMLHNLLIEYYEDVCTYCPTSNISKCYIIYILSKNYTYNNYI